MSGEYALDTNVISAWYRRELDLPARVGADGRAVLPVIVAGELLFGLQSLQSEKRAGLEGFIIDLLDSLPVLPVDVETARVYGLTRHRLKMLGRPIPENDLWIAALAICHNVTLVSRDARFEAIEGLSLARW